MDINFKDISLKNIDELLKIALKKQSHNPNGTYYSSKLYNYIWF